MSDSPTSNLRLAEARDIVASGTSGKSLPVIEFMDAQQAEIERLDGLWRTEKARADFNFEENERLRAALVRIEALQHQPFTTPTPDCEASEIAAAALANETAP